MAILQNFQIALNSFFNILERFFSFFALTHTTRKHRRFSHKAVVFRIILQKNFELLYLFHSLNTNLYPSRCKDDILLNSHGYYVAGKPTATAPRPGWLENLAGRFWRCSGRGIGLPSLGFKHHPRYDG